MFLVHAFKRFKDQGGSGLRQSIMRRSSRIFRRTNVTELPLPSMTSNPLYEDCFMLRENLIPRKRIEIQCKVASGQFGTVFKGILKPLYNDEEDIEVAIKAPKVSMLNSDTLNDFYTEANTAIKFDNENVLKCFGMSDGPKELPYLLFEFMHFGDLAKILANQRSYSNNCIYDKKLPILTQVRVIT